jgi:hypothetical protein
LPFCVTVTDCPPTVRVAVRGDVPGFGDTTTVAVPLPEPLPLSVIHEGAPDDVHLHPSCVVTVSVLVPPAAFTARVSGETV